MVQTSGGPAAGHCGSNPVSFDTPVRSGPCHCGQSNAAAAVVVCMSGPVAGGPAAIAAIPKAHTSVKTRWCCIEPAPLVAETPEYKNIWENSEMLSLRRPPVPAGCALLALALAPAAAHAQLRTTLPPITVTAQKAPEDPQNVPVSVTAVPAQTLED